MLNVARCLLSASSRLLLGGERGPYKLQVNATRCRRKASAPGPRVDSTSSNPPRVRSGPLQIWSLTALTGHGKGRMNKQIPGSWSSTAVPPARVAPHGELVLLAWVSPRPYHRAFTSTQIEWSGGDNVEFTSWSSGGRTLPVGLKLLRRIGISLRMTVETVRKSSTCKAVSITSNHFSGRLDKLHLQTTPSTVAPLRAIHTTARARSHRSS